MNISTVIEQVSILGIIMLIGYICVKSGYADGKLKDSLSKIIVKIILPCLIISSVTSKEIKEDMIGEIVTVLLLSLFCIAVLYLMGMLTAKLLGIPDFTSRVHKLLASLGNVVFIGYPIISAVYGEDGFFYGIIYWLVNDMFLWTAGVLMLSGGEKASVKDIAKKLVNPNTISFVTAILMLSFGIRLPGVLGSAVSGIGSLTTALSMIFIGMALGQVDMRNAMKKWWIFVIAPLKLAVIPVLLILLFKALGIDDMILGVVVLQAAMPAQTVLSILANEHDADSEYAAVGMFVTTVMGIFTLPLMCRMIEILT